tara:strand:- start:751 stop:1041 length:291 start_codon:yes stop_codon:yes gene_type:complete
MISTKNLSPEDIAAALEELRSQKDNPESPAYFMYSILSTAHPTALEFFEYQAAIALMAGKAARKNLTEAFASKEGRNALRRHMSEAKNESEQSEES